MQQTVIQQQLENGITVVLVPLPGTAAVTSIVLMGVGSRYESDAQQGLAHFTEHMVFKGGKKFTTAQQIAQAIDAVGGEFNAFTSEEFTGFYTKTGSEHTELGLDVLSDMLLHATFPAAELEKEKGVIVEEVNMYEDMPMRKVHHVLEDLIFGDTPVGRPILGQKSTVTAFTRDDFVHYREQFYKGVKCVIVLAGAVEASAVDLVAKYFGEMPKGETYNPVPVQFQSDRRVALSTRSSEQTHLLLAVPGYSLNDPKRHAFRLMATLLGGNMSSRLFVSVREEQGLCYYVRASADASMDHGLLVCSAGVDNARLDVAVKAIVAELQKLKDEPVSAEELERSKQFQLGKLFMSMEDSEQVAEFYGVQQVLEGRIETLEDLKRDISAITAEEIQEIAREIFTTENLRLAVVGPQKDAAALEQLLTFN
jgi:predicted Zn-dependent peptidase